MLLELSEILACPACGPPQVMVAVVHESRGRDVTVGMLACPSCDGRWPIAGGVAWLGRHHAAPVPPDEDPDPDVAQGPAEESAVLTAALLGLESGGGLLLFGPGLAGPADVVARMAGRCNIISLSSSRPPGRGPEPAREVPNVSRLVVPGGEPLPLQSNCVRGAVLEGRAAAPELAEAARTLVPGGRLVVLDPGESSISHVEGAGLEVRASDHRALLAVRPLTARP